MPRQKNIINASVAVGTQAFYSVLGGSESRGESAGRMGGFVVVVVVVVVVFVVVGGRLVLWDGFGGPEPPFEV